MPHDTRLGLAYGDGVHEQPVYTVLCVDCLELVAAKVDHADPSRTTCCMLWLLELAEARVDDRVCGLEPRRGGGGTSGYCPLCCDVRFSKPEPPLPRTLSGRSYLDMSTLRVRHVRLDARIVLDRPPVEVLARTVEVYAWAQLIGDGEARGVQKQSGAGATRCLLTATASFCGHDRARASGAVMVRGTPGVAKWFQARAALCGGVRRAVSPPLHRGPRGTRRLPTTDTTAQLARLIYEAHGEHAVHACHAQALRLWRDGALPAQKLESLHHDLICIGTLLTRYCAGRPPTAATSSTRCGLQAARMNMKIEVPVAAGGNLRMVARKMLWRRPTAGTGRDAVKRRRASRTTHHTKAGRRPTPPFQTQRSKGSTSYVYSHANTGAVY